MNIDEKTKFLLSVAMCTDKYSSYLGVDNKIYSSILGYVMRFHQEKLKGITPQGIALLLVYLKDKKEVDYPKYLDLYKDKVDNIISSSKTIEEQLNKMNDIG